MGVCIELHKDVVAFRTISVITWGSAEQRKAM